MTFYDDSDHERLHTMVARMTDEQVRRALDLLLDDANTKVEIEDEDDHPVHCLCDKCVCARCGESFRKCACKRNAYQTSKLQGRIR